MKALACTVQGPCSGFLAFPGQWAGFLVSPYTSDMVPKRNLPELLSCLCLQLHWFFIQCNTRGRANFSWCLQTVSSPEHLSHTYFKRPCQFRIPCHLLTKWKKAVSREKLHVPPLYKYGKQAEGKIFPFSMGVSLLLLVR